MQLNAHESFTMTAAEWIDLSKNAPLDFPPGTSYNYSNCIRKKLPPTIS